MRSTIFAFGLMASGAMAAQTLNVFWNYGSYETIPGTVGNEIGHDGGFTIFDNSGKTIYANKYPGDHAPCYNTGDGRFFTLKLPCWKKSRSFKCKSTFDGGPHKCDVYTSTGCLESSGEGSSSTDFYGFLISITAHCGVQIALTDDEICSEDESDKGVVS